MKAEGHDHRGCACAICDLKLDFDLDPHLIEEIERQNCVIFAGAGISTETRYTHPVSFYNTIRTVVGTDDEPPFPVLIDRLEARPNGRQKLIQAIIDRFAYINGFRELHGAATRFHRELATMPYFSTVVTTNCYFEEICGATPFVYEGDVPFWGIADRAVLKIHGSIDNYSSIVASSEDYQRCQDRLRDGAIGAVLKQLFATKTFIFAGYSATDPDFLSIFETIRSGLGPFARTHYIVSPYLNSEQSERLRQLRIVGIKTDATHFLSIIKAHMIKKFCFSSDTSYDETLEFLVELREVHEAFVGSYRPATSPHLIFATVYQDGMIHALERIVDQKSSGRLSDLHAVRRQISGYEEMIRNYQARRDYWEVSYFSGYKTGLEFFDLINVLSIDECGWPPPFFHPGFGQMSEQDYEEKVRPAPQCHKAALAQAKAIIRKSNAWNAEVIQHLPWAS